MLKLAKIAELPRNTSCVTPVIWNAPTINLVASNAIALEPADEKEVEYTPTIDAENVELL
jgi:hypothetical protein